MKKLLLSLCGLAFGLSLFAQSATTASELTFAIRAQVIPQGIQLIWNKQVGVNAYNVLRKARSQKTFTVMATNLPANDTTYTDNTVLPGQAFEYCVQSASSISVSAYAYAGIELPAVHQAGEILLLIDSTYMLPAATELETFRQDLIKEGWRVFSEYIGRNQPVSSVKQLIGNYYNQNTSQFKGVILMGHIPVPYSGKIAPDAHADHIGAWPSDIFYADVNAVQSPWNDVNINAVSASDPRNHNIIGDGKYDLSVKSTTSNIKIFVGRIDVFNMPAINPDDVYLFKQYLNKNHAYRSGQNSFRMEGIIDDEFGFFGGEAFAQNGWRNFNSLLGNQHVEAGDLLTKTSNDSYIWSYACGGGWNTGAQGIGTTSSFASAQYKSVFTMLYGSYFGDWDNANNFLRAPIASPSASLVSCWGGRPNWFFHTMSLGEPIGYSYLNSVDNVTTYYPKGLYSGQVHQSLQGDPSLTMYVYQAPSNVAALGVDQNTRTQITWMPSNDPAVQGYYLYKANDLNSSFTLLNAAPISATYYFDETTYDPAAVYMVRAVKLEQTNTGTFHNLSRGALSTDFVNTPLSVSILSFEGFARADGSNVLTWTTEQEDGVAGYTLQRSEDQQLFEDLTWIPAQNKGGQIQYDAVDASPAPVMYYRLVARDIDGKEKISEIVRLEHKALISEMIAWPTPFQNQVTVAFESTSDGEAEILVTDLYGHTITHEVILVHEGRNTRQFQGLDRLSAGIYLVQVQDADQQRHVFKIQKAN